MFTLRRKIHTSAKIFLYSENGEGGVDIDLFKKGEDTRFKETSGTNNNSVDIPSDGTAVGEDSNKKQIDLEMQKRRENEASEHLRLTHGESSEIAKETEAPFRHPESPEATNIKNELETELSREFL